MGALVGVSLALLFAPASGEELIDRMQAETERVKTEVRQAAQDRRGELEQQLEALRAPRPAGKA